MKDVILKAVANPAQIVLGACSADGAECRFADTLYVYGYRNG